jgi:hypothetical protein
MRDAWQILALGKPKGKHAVVQIHAHQFALHAQRSETFAVSASPDPAFVEVMPITIRDALGPLPSSADARNLPSHGLRPVNYDDLSPWLGSSLAVRADAPTRIAERFHVRLEDPAFRRDFTHHLPELADWRPLVFCHPSALYKA